MRTGKVDVYSNDVVTTAIRVIGFHDFQLRELNEYLLPLLSLISKVSVNTSRVLMASIHPAEVDENMKEAFASISIIFSM